MRSSRDVFLSNLQSLHERMLHEGPLLEVTARDFEIGLEGHVAVWGGRSRSRSEGLGPLLVGPSITRDLTATYAKRWSLVTSLAGLPSSGSCCSIRINAGNPALSKLHSRFKERISGLFLNQDSPLANYPQLAYDLNEHRYISLREDNLNRIFPRPGHLGAADNCMGFLHATATAQFIECYDDFPERLNMGMFGLSPLGIATLRHLTRYGLFIRYVGDQSLGGTFEIPEVLVPELVSLQEKGHYTALREVIREKGKKISEHAESVMEERLDVCLVGQKTSLYQKAAEYTLGMRYIVEIGDWSMCGEASKHLHNLSIRVLPSVVALSAFAIFLSDDTAEGIPLDTLEIGMQARKMMDSVQSQVIEVHSLAASCGITCQNAADYLALSRFFLEDDKRTYSPYGLKAKPILPRRAVA